MIVVCSVVPCKTGSVAPFPVTKGINNIPRNILYKYNFLVAKPKNCPFIVNVFRNLIMPVNSERPTDFYNQKFSPYRSVILARIF